MNGVDLVIPIDQVQRLWVMRQGISTGKTVALVAGVAAGPLAVVGIVEFVKALRAPSFGCPFVYAWDGDRFMLDAELYGGAISRGLERPDYSELPHLRAQHGSYRILLSNELEEADFTDSLELWSVDHPAGTRAGIDNDGKLYSMANPRPPLEARDETGADLRPWFEAPDRRIWEATPADSPNGRLRHEITMTFARPPGAQSARLFVHAGTGEWGMRMLSAIYELYGTGIDARMAALDGDPAEAQSIRDWSAREEVYELKIRVEEPSGWQVRGAIPGGGMGGRVVPLDISRVTGDKLRIRLLPPAGFWAINSAAIDYSPDRPLSATRIAPASARSQGGRSVLRELRRADGAYYKAERGESALRGPGWPGTLRRQTLCRVARGSRRNELSRARMTP